MSPSPIFCLIFTIFLIIDSSLSAPLPRNFDNPGPCDPNNCKLPECFCSGTEIPLGLNRDEIPQMVLLTFDDGVMSTNFQDYDDLFSNRYNPNGSPVSATYFVSHDYSDYYLIRKLYERGHEIALHTISHAKTGLPSNGQNEALWRQEIEDHRKLMSHFAKIPLEDIKGFRAPFLQMGGDTMFKVLMDSGLEYDYSRTTRNEYAWPYTADYESNEECSFPPCHSKSYPGIWIVPNINFRSRTGLPCAMVDACNPVPHDAEETFQLLLENFLGHYNGNRAPMAVPLHPAWLTHSGHKEGYRRFLDYLGSLPNVYIVGISQALDWMKSPVTVNRAREIDSWNRNLNESKGVRSSGTDDCSTMHKCFYNTDATPLGFEHSFVSCQPCPPRYPWLGNPFGKSLKPEITSTSQEKATDSEPSSGHTGTEIILPAILSADIISGKSPATSPSAATTLWKATVPFSTAATTVRPKTTAPIPISVQKETTHAIKTESIGIKANQSTTVQQVHALKNTSTSSKIEVLETTAEVLKIQMTAPEEILPPRPNSLITPTPPPRTEATQPAKIPIKIDTSTSTEGRIEDQDVRPEWDQWVKDNHQKISSGQWVDDTSLWKYDAKKSLGDSKNWNEGPGQLLVKDNHREVNSGQWVDDTSLWKYDAKQSLGDYGRWDVGPGQWVDDTKSAQYNNY